MEAERIFGTDGVRGRAGEGWLASDRVSALGRAVGRMLARELRRAGRGEHPRALLGHDGRRSAAELGLALARGLAASGFEVHSAGLLPSPGLAHLVRDCGFELGAMLSASHNPAQDNGIKVFSAQGEKLSDELEREVEGELARSAEPVTEGPPPRPAEELVRRYEERLLADGPRLDGLSVVLDCANGAASRIGPRVLRALGAELRALHAAPDGDNINRDCGSTSPASLCRAVLEERADVGIALDGDADRCLAVDERGTLVDGDGILTLLSHQALRQGAWPVRRVVATVMSNRGLQRALRQVGVEVLTVGVGDRNVSEALRREGLSLGGEQSGHIIFGPDHGYIGDGLYTALRILAVLRETGQTLSALTAPFQAFPQVLRNVTVREKPAWEGLPGVQAAVASAEIELGEDGRVLLRYSGTEPLARVMVEGPDREVVERHAAAIAGQIEEAIGSLRSA